MIVVNGIFRYCFPFGRPEGALKATLSLLERVLMKDIVTPILPEEVRGMIKKSLETAALVNYTRLSGEARIEGEHFQKPYTSTSRFNPASRLTLPYHHQKML